MFKGLILSVFTVMINSLNAAVPDDAIMYHQRHILKEQYFYSNLGWDFETIWEIREGHQYPVFRSSREVNGMFTVLNPEFKLWTVHKGVQIKSEYDFLLTVFHMNGQKMFNMSVYPGQQFISLPDGIYLLVAVVNEITYTYKAIIN